jgi:RyR domain
MLDLSEAEHERWMRKLLADGWRWGPEKDPVRKIHPLLVPWSELADAEKDKDANTIRTLPVLLARAGYAIVRKSSANNGTEQSAAEHLAD